jgi:hypothetical protein
MAHILPGQGLVSMITGLTFSAEATGNDLSCGWFDAYASTFSDAFLIDADGGGPDTVQRIDCGPSILG